MKFSFMSGVSLAAIAAALSCGQALAQDAEVTVLEAITVTATKRVQEAFEVAATVEQAGGEELRERGVVSLGQLDKVFADTSIKPRSSRAYTNVTIRGQSSVDFYNPSVQVYVDGLPQDPTTLAQLLPAGIENVELLYGPQGTLYGRGAIGGVVNVVTRKPDNIFRVDASGSLSTLGGDASLLVNVPIVDGVLYGDAAITYRREADDYTVMGTDDKIGGTDDINGRLRLRYAPDDSPLDITVTAQRGRVTSSEEQFVMEADVAERIALPVPSEYTLDSTNIGITASYDLGNATITSISGYQETDLDRTIFGTYTPERQKTFSQELRLASNPDQGNAIDYVVGVYGQALDFERDIPAYSLLSQQDIYSYALFGEVTWHATDRLDITPGLRFDYEYAKAHAEGTVMLDDDASFTALSPKIGASYALTDEWRLYGLFSTGFKAGGFTRNVTVENIAFTYDPQHTYNFEGGVKYRSLDGRLEASLAGYYNITKDYQMFVGVQPVQYLQNVGEVTAAGLNLSVRAEVLDAVGITGGLGINRTTFTDYHNPVTPTVNRTGNVVPYAPEVTGNIALDYTFDLGDRWGQLIPRVGLTYTSAVYFDETNTIGQKAYALVDLGISWKVNDNAVADIFVNNVFDETYATYGFTDTTYGNLYQLGSGRTFGGRVSFTF
jgi:pesticin/yersiniabactin receptor